MKKKLFILLSSIGPRLFLVWYDIRTGSLTTMVSVGDCYNKEILEFIIWRNRIIIIFYASLGLVIPVFSERPIFIMIDSQAFTIIITPIVVFITLIFIKNSLMGEYKVSNGRNLILGIFSLSNNVGYRGFYSY